MTEIESDPPASADELIASLAEMESEPSGLTTFARYTWQAKQAVRQWITCLHPNGPRYIVCEQVEDIVLVQNGIIRFLQYKTKDKGSWSAATMCSSGMDALVRSYNTVKGAGRLDSSKFELWLEGAISAGPTDKFVKDPTGAEAGVRGSLVSQGMARSDVDDFLSRLEIKPNVTSQDSTDAIICLEMGTIWSQLTISEIKHLYERLLQAAAAAQAGDLVPQVVSTYIDDMMSPSTDLDVYSDPVSEALSAMRPQVLSSASLRRLVPPLQRDSDDVLSNIGRGTGLSRLELKLKRGGASAETIEFAKLMRAEMDVERQMLVAASDRAVDDLDKLAVSVLAVARATANRSAFSSVSNPSAAARPAEAIASDLVANPSALAACDRARLFDGNGLVVYGFLGHLSDECKFPWRAA